MNTRLKVHENDARNSKNFSVYDLHKMSVASSQNELKITYKMPFDETKIYKLIVSGGIRIAASQLSIMSSFLFTNLNQSEIHKGVTLQRDINSELWFFAGVGLGGLFSVILFLTCFVRGTRKEKEEEQQ